MSDEMKNKVLFEKYEKEHGEKAIIAIRKDYKKMFKEEPPFWPGDIADALSKYTIDEVIDIYLTALREEKPYKLQDSDIIEFNIDSSEPNTD